ncbi:MAG: IS21 family transposase [Chloroflexota bacterium]|nr:IS21 family transposase [Chloroflexota bacterium]
MTRVELFEQIRRDARLEGLSVRALAERHHVHRRTVRQALAAALPPPRKAPAREAPVLGPWKAIIRGWLEADQRSPRKQRHTGRRIWQRLRAEYGASVAEPTVRAYVGQVRAELHSRLREVTIPQVHLPGAEAECDFGDCYIDVAGVRTRLFLFHLRLSASGRAFHRAYTTQAQEAFLDGHVAALAHFGGVPGRIRYDNLRPAVIRVLVGRTRQEHDRFVALRSHYGFDAFFCLPGSAGAHEKGGVEGEVGRFRRTHLVPVPQVASLAELHTHLTDADRQDDLRRIQGRSLTVGEAFAAEADHLQPLPAEPFDAARLLSVRVDTKARICVRQSWYSVPARLAGRRLTVRLSATKVEVLDGGTVVAHHERALHRGTEVLALDHYLDVLSRKPGALPGARALAQARASGTFTAEHETFWTTARGRLGDSGGTKALIEVLLVHRTLPTASVLAGIRHALALGSVDAALVAIEARRAAAAHPVVRLPLETLARYDRPLPVIQQYDTLLAVAR